MQLTWKSHPSQRLSFSQKKVKRRGGALSGRDFDVHEIKCQPRRVDCVSVSRRHSSSVQRSTKPLRYPLDGSKPAHEGQFCLCSVEFAAFQDWLVERGRFEPPVPLGCIWAEFGPSSAHYSARIKASVLERICSPGVRLYFGSLRFPSFRQTDVRNPVTSNTRRGFGVRISPLGRAVSKSEPC